MSQTNAQLLADSLGTISTGTIPIGGIILWSGTIATIPDGWALCNGSNGTPNLRDRFVLGASSDGADTAYPVVRPGGTGGRADSVMHNHIHGFTTDPGGAHNHFDNGPGPAVTQAGFDVDGNSNSARVDINDGPPFEGIVWNISEGSHQHSGITAGSDTNPIYVGGVGAALVNDSRLTNLPPYYALAYIMRTS